jgi:hypothetical protein
MENARNTMEIFWFTKGIIKETASMGLEYYMNTINLET